MAFRRVLVIGVYCPGIPGLGYEIEYAVDNNGPLPTQIVEHALATCHDRVTKQEMKIREEMASDHHQRSAD